jgi:hypothetical protein
VSNILYGVERSSFRSFWIGMANRCSKNQLLPIEEAHDISSLQARVADLRRTSATFVTSNLAHSTQKTRDFL